ncbi:MAG: glutamine synthetase [Clostridia bacterium]|nr:glutamine synthetase [Clostridia bacterium]
MDYTKSEVMSFVSENDVKFIRLAFCDITGAQKNIAVMASELPRAFEEGIMVDGAAIPGFAGVEHSDLMLHPDPATLAVLPWRPSHGRVVRMYCDVTYPDGRQFECDNRHIVRTAEAALLSAGYTCKIGSECEFYLFNTDEKGSPTLEPCDQAGYMDVAPLDRGENVRRSVCLTLEEMGIKPESSHHEQGPGQNEVDFMYASPLVTCDNTTTFRAVVKTAAAQNGFFASFLPKPLPDFSGSGQHLNISVYKNGIDLFGNSFAGDRRIADSFMAGILTHIRELTVFLNPIPNSYERFGVFEAPQYVSWSVGNRSQLVRIPECRGNGARMELRSADCAMNPYLGVALLIYAGLDGIKRELPLQPADNRDLFSTVDSSLPTLPMSLSEAIAVAEDSEFLRGCLPAKLLENYLALKRSETALDVKAYFPKI